VPATPSDLVNAARDGQFVDVHDALLQATATHHAAPHDLLGEVGEALAGDDRRLPPRARVALRLMRAGALEPAWLVLQDNAVGFVERTLRAGTMAGGRPTSPKLPLTTWIEPPNVYAWLPGFRDPRWSAPDAAYDVTDLVTASVRLDEMWWDGYVLVLAGLATLRHLTATPDDEVVLVLRDDAGGEVVVQAARHRRPDLVKGTGADLTRVAWAGWSTRVDLTRVPPGRRIALLRLTCHGIQREVKLGRSRLDTVPTRTVAGIGGRFQVRASDAGTSFTGLTRLQGLLQSPRRVLHVIARSARRR
jgi:hypothetical protein